MGRKPISVPTGTRYGRLVVLEEAERRGPKRLRQFRCKCDCGGVKVVLFYHLRNGVTSSCGCLRSGRRTTHGLSGSQEYNSWHFMIHRCLNPTSKDYKRYGGRGITVCDRWKESIEAFLADMGPRPSAKHVLGRIDMDGNYEPGNCSWITRTQQARNTRRNRLVTYQGQTKCITEWAEEVGIHHSILRNRLKQGWSAERMLTMPVRESRQASELLEEIRRLKDIIDRELPSHNG